MEFNLSLSKSVLDQLPFGVAFIDEDNILKYFNHVMAEEFHYQTERIGQNAISCHRPENQSRVEAILYGFKNGKKDKISLIHTTRNTNKKILTEYLPLYSEDQLYIGALCVLKDITKYLDH